MRTVLPWLAAFAFGAVMFLVGKYLQSIEKRKRLERKVLDRAFGASAKPSSVNVQAPPLFGEMGGYQGKAQEKQGQRPFTN
jgi:hypothetical protein